MTRKGGIDVCRVFVNEVIELGEYWYDSLKKMKLCVCVSVFLPNTAMLLMILFLFVHVVDEEPNNK